MEKNTILEQVNAYGAKLGWPFYVYPDGTCGKSIVSAGGKLNAAMFVKKKFPVRALNSEFLTGTAGAEDDVLAHLCEVGDKLGYPLYVYADGTCGTTPVSPENKFPFTLVVKKKFVVNQMVLETEDSVWDATDADNATGNAAVMSALAKCAVSGNGKLRPVPKQAAMTAEDKELLAAARKNIFKRLSIKELRALFQFGTADEVRRYVRDHGVLHELEKLLLLRGDAELVSYYLSCHSIEEDSCTLLAVHYDDDIVLEYTGKYVFETALTEALLKAGRFSLLEKIQEQGSLYVCNRLGFYSPHVAVILKAGHPELLKTQIRKYGNWQERDIPLLLKSGNKEMIKYYLDYHELKESGQKELVEFGDAELAQLYQMRYGFSNEVYQLAKWRGLL